MQRKWQKYIIESKGIHGCWSGNYPQIICKSGVVSQLADLCFLTFKNPSKLHGKKKVKKFKDWFLFNVTCVINFLLT